MAIKVLRSLPIGGFRYFEKMNSCGKPNCKCSRCTHGPQCRDCWHGPYWYRQFTTKKGITITDYLGKLKPQEIAAFEQDAAQARREWHQALRGEFSES